MSQFTLITFLAYHLISGATVPEYVVTADDVDTLLAVDCTPMDDSGRQVSYYHHSQLF